MTVAVVGTGSLIAAALRRRPDAAAWRFVRWQDAVSDGRWLDGVDRVVNCAYDASLRAGAAYAPALDVDLRLARLVLAHGRARYLMLSTRAVYGPPDADGVLREDRPPRPDRPYGASKLETERALGALLGARLTVLRLSNVIGDGSTPGRRTFVAVALASLRERGAIVLDVDPAVARDFVPDDAVAAAIARVAATPRAGTYNVGSGVATPVGRVAQALIDGYGTGRIDVVDARRHDAFVLDVGAARAAFGIGPVPPEAIVARCVAIGRAMRDATAGGPGPRDAAAGARGAA